MPIKPENRARYPANWKAIRAAILERAGNRCEWAKCGVANRSIGIWKAGVFSKLADSKHDPDMSCLDAEQDGEKLTEIVLTIAHLGSHTRALRPIQPDGNVPTPSPGLRPGRPHHQRLHDAQGAHANTGAATMNTPTGFRVNTKLPTNLCAADGCGLAVPKTLLMCSSHWKQVPAPLQRRVLTTYHALPSRTLATVAAYRLAVDLAKQAVQTKATAKANTLELPL